MNYNHQNGFTTLTEQVLTVTLALIILSTVGLNAYDLLVSGFSNFSNVEKSFATANLALLKLDNELNSVVLTNADNQQLSFTNQDNQLINYSVSADSLLRSQDAGTNYLALSNVLAADTNFQYFDANLIELTSLPLNPADLASVKFIKLNITTNNQDIINNYSNIKALN